MPYSGTERLFRSRSSKGAFFYASGQAEGIAAARARGVRFGRPTKKSPENFGEVVKQWERGTIHFDEACERTGLKQATFYNRLREYRAGRNKKGV